MPASAIHDPREADPLGRRDVPDFAYRFVGHVSLFCLVLLVCSFLPDFANKGISATLAKRDFVNYWTAAHLAADGRVADIFGPQPRYFVHLTALFGQGFPWHNWSYPPHYLMLMMPLALTGYKFGIIIFLFITGLFFWKGLVAFMGRPDRLALIAVSPLIVANILMIQNGFLTSGLILWFLALRDKRPIVAGLCMGMLTIKPQLGLLLPIIPLVERRWTLLLAAGLTTFALILFSACIFGADAWIGFFRDILPYQARVMARLEGSWLTMMPSLFGGVRLLGYGATTALWVHMIVAVPVLALTLLCLSVSRSQHLPDTLLPISMFLVLPYVLNYDFGAVGAGLALFIRKEDALGRPFSVGEKILLAVTMLLPLSMMGIGLFRVDIAPAILLGAFVLVILRTDALGELRDHMMVRIQRLSVLIVSPPSRLK